MGDPGGVAEVVGVTSGIADGGAAYDDARRHGVLVGKYDDRERLEDGEEICIRADLYQWRVGVQKEFPKYISLTTSWVTSDGLRVNVPSATWSGSKRNSQIPQIPQDLMLVIISIIRLRRSHPACFESNMLG
jgi:hypothetical protein